MHPTITLLEGVVFKPDGRIPFYVIVKAEASHAGLFAVIRYDSEFSEI